MSRKIFCVLVLGLVSHVFGASKADEESKKELAAYYASLPDAKFPAFNEQQAMALTLPLACVDRPQALELRQHYQTMS